jgi:DNA-directed RNA polymerase subunit RPC12/RpoP
VSLGKCTTCGKDIYAVFVINENCSDQRAKSMICPGCRVKRSQAERRKKGVVSTLWPPKRKSRPRKWSGI